MQEFENDDKLYQNLISILKLFKNRPYHLAKYLIENQAFNQEFIDKILVSDKLNDINSDNNSNNAIVKAVYFLDISHMTDYFNSFFEEAKDNKKSIQTITKELNDKLDECLRDEKYEDAIRIRDYMSKNNIKRISKQ